MRNAALVAVVVQGVLVQAAWVGVRLMIGYRALDTGADAAMLGVIAAAFATPALIAAIPAGRLSDRIGGPIVVVVGLATATAGIGALLVWDALWVLPAGAAVIGLGNLFVMVGQQSFVAHISDGRSGDRNFGILTASASAGQLLGPLTVTFVASSSWFGGAGLGSVDTAAGIGAAGVFTVAALPVTVWLVSRGHTRRERSATSARTGFGLLRTPGLGRSIAVSAAVLVTVDLMYTFVPLWATANGVSAEAVGWLLALRAAVSIASRIGLGRLVERFGRTALLRVSIVVGAAGLAVLPFVGWQGGVPVMIALGIALGIPQPLTMTWVVSLVPRSVHGEVLGLRLSANRLAQIAVPLVVGATAGPFGITAVFLANAAVLAAALGALVRPEADP